MDDQGSREVSSFWRGIGIPAVRRISFSAWFMKMRSGEERLDHFLPGGGGTIMLTVSEMEFCCDVDGFCCCGNC